MSYSKYRAKKVTIDNIKFDSLKEGNRYKELKLMERANIISNLRCHVPYVLIKKSKYGSDVKYIADFVYIDDGKEVVEDVKSKATITSVYRLKKRLMAEVYGIIIKEVF